MIELILEDYLASLKEKDELDILLSDLLKLDGYTVKSLPKTGERQYGVDLLAEKGEEIYLYVIKQGDLTRKIWDGDNNSVRQSFSEIFDVYLDTMLDSSNQSRKKNIVFVTNGIIKDAVRPNWEGYKKSNSTENINISSILLPDLVNLVFQQGFNETLFDKSKRSKLRKCLYFLDEPDYKLDFFESIISGYFEELEKVTTRQKKNKIFSSLQMLLSLVNHNAHEKQRYRISIQFTEYVLISMWSYMQKKNCFENSLEVLWLHKFIRFYIDSNEKFMDNLRPFSTIRNGLPSYNPVEYRVLCFEILGYISVYAAFLSTVNISNNLDLKYSAEDTVNLLISLMNNNYGFYYPVYDNDGIEVSLLFYVMLLQRNITDVEMLVKRYISHVFANIRSGKYPILERQYNLAMEIEFQETDYLKRYSASFLWGVLLEWAMLTEQDDLVKQILAFDFLSEATIQNWNCSSEEETNLYIKNEIHMQGYTDILNELEPKETKKMILDTSKIANFKHFSFIEYSFPAIGLMISRKYRVPVIPSYWRREFINRKE
ncbi:hypothetical protein IBB39_12685 [Listeria seeligeri]|uniref:hypothetical protein n=1 Tax=Listeria seeligeri TaxID=1640 RepID=UPI001628314C|nr:hypothetical protein [Listeria seeligeri]MBC1895537.1 hypothetical protein [Listeria seeligeri]MBC1990679.1 hypothetical protein [Listeria seeligeri]MBC2045986.1 hypothetical protein [Listeria seeligeri]MBC2051931.1 hypothetical protein [Listeria seeligeri]MBC2058998.1 hypothetical protein [Listeria seeligeri]